ncbi:hypothetical protein [Streptomyces ochraceiscleroticus]|uniref:Uncharacterized protein n=1 Tax=Streptomyces ochraceiscleroticus TaxID=47761 RepID=A0ABW1MSZ9_9ACTN|nr:hypothetical protein [Streptomyces ochraceiscleroticus]
MSRNGRVGMPVRVWRLARRAADDPVVRMLAVALLQVAAARIEQSGGPASARRGCGEGVCKAGQLT